MVQCSTLEECELGHALVGLTSTDTPVVVPDRCPGVRGFHPLPFLDDLGVRLLDDSAHFAERLAPPVAQLLDSRVYQLRRRLAFLRSALLPLLHLLLFRSEVHG